MDQSTKPTNVWLQLTIPIAILLVIVTTPHA